MSDHNELPEFSNSGDAREEALWQAYQAMLRRRKEPRARWSAPEEPSSEPTPDPVPPPPAPATRAGSGRSGARWLAIFGSALVLAGGTALAIVLWPRSPATPDQSAPIPAPAARRPAPLPTPSATPLAPPSAGVASPPALAAITTPAPLPRVEADAAPKPQAASGVRVLAPSDGLAKRPRSPATPAKPPRAAAARLGRNVGPRRGRNGERAQRPALEVSTGRSPDLAVRDFYNALAKGDGARAAAVVVPEKRDDGPLSAGELTRTYASLRSPIRITKIETIDDDKVFVRYHFVTADSHVCLGSAIVDTTRRDGAALVSGIHVFHGC